MTKNRMSIRDYFAGQALIGILSNSNESLVHASMLLSPPNNRELKALGCYLMADAMIKARKVTHDKKRS